MKALFIILPIVCVLFIAFLIIDIIDLNRFVVREYTLTSDKFAKNFKFAFISDLHNKDYGNDNEEIFEALENAKVDFVLVGGDIITASENGKNEEAVTFMKRLSEQYDVYFGLGNHEYRAKIYPQTYGSMYEDFMKELKDAGVNVLINDHVELLEYGIRISGLMIGREYYKRFRLPEMEVSYLDSVLGKHSDENYEILIAHNPDYFPQYAEYGADLSLSGHIHGGLIRLPGLGGIASPAVRFFPKYDGGIYETDGKKGIVSCGLGTHTIPLRIFNPGELTIITCEKTEKDLQ